MSWRVMPTRHYLYVEHRWADPPSPGHPADGGVFRWQIPWDWPWKMIQLAHEANRIMDEAEEELLAELERQELEVTTANGHP